MTLIELKHLKLSEWLKLSMEKISSLSHKNIESTKSKFAARRGYLNWLLGSGRRLACHFCRALFRGRRRVRRSGVGFARPARDNSHIKFSTRHCQKTVFDARGESHKRVIYHSSCNSHWFEFYWVFDWVRFVELIKWFHTAVYAIYYLLGPIDLSILSGAASNFMPDLNSPRRLS